MAEESSQTVAAKTFAAIAELVKADDADPQVVSPQDRKALIKAMDRAAGVLRSNCKNHIFNEKSDSAYCTICGQDFGWKCEKSPDGVCHYFSEEKDGQQVVELIEGKGYHVLPSSYEPADETDDSCIFCGEPDERK